MHADITVELIEQPATGYQFRTVPHPSTNSNTTAHAPNVGTLLTGRTLQPADAAGCLRALGTSTPFSRTGGHPRPQALRATLESQLHLRFQQLPDADSADIEPQILALCDRYGPLMPQDAPFQVLETAEFWLARAREMRELTERQQADSLTDDDFEAVSGLVGPVEAPNGSPCNRRVRSLLAGLWLQWCEDSKRYAGLCEHCRGPMFTGETGNVSSDLCRLRLPDPSA